MLKAILSMTSAADETTTGMDVEEIQLEVEETEPATPQEPDLGVSEPADGGSERSSPVWMVAPSVAALSVAAPSEVSDGSFQMAGAIHYVIGDSEPADGGSERSSEVWVVDPSVAAPSVAALSVVSDGSFQMAGTTQEHAIGGSEAALSTALPSDGPADGGSEHSSAAPWVAAPSVAAPSLVSEGSFQMAPAIGGSGGSGAEKEADPTATHSQRTLAIAALGDQGMDMRAGAFVCTPAAEPAAGGSGGGLGPLVINFNLKPDDGASSVLTGGALAPHSPSSDSEPHGNWSQRPPYLPPGALAQERPITHRDLTDGDHSLTSSFLRECIPPREPAVGGSEPAVGGSGGSEPAIGGSEPAVGGSGAEKEADASMEDMGSCKLISTHYADYGLQDYGLQKAHMNIYIYIYISIDFSFIVLLSLYIYIYIYAD